MQFQYNSDFPGLSDGIDGSSPQYIPRPAAQPLQFPPAHPLPCARITTRVYHPSRNQVATIQNVLVRTGSRTTIGASAVANRQGLNANQHAAAATTLTSHIVSLSDTESSNLQFNSNSQSHHDDGMSSSSSSSFHTTDSSSMMTDDHDHDDIELASPRSTPDRAYWLQRTIRDAIYGRVVFALVLERMSYNATTEQAAEWQVTSQQVAVKEMSWQHIRRERDRLAEDPITEVAAMQYLMEMVTTSRKQQTEDDEYTDLQGDSSVQDSLKAVLETNIMMPLDLLSDDGHLYSIMPYCNGGELFERLDMNEKFSEEEARYWMTQICNVRPSV